MRQYAHAQSRLSLRCPSKYSVWMQSDISVGYLESLYFFIISVYFVKHFCQLFIDQLLFMREYANVQSRPSPRC